jgi:hypothetical protein
MFHVKHLAGTVARIGCDREAFSPVAVTDLLYAMAAWVMYYFFDMSEI